MDLDVVVSNVRPWLGEHYSNSVPLVIAEDVECSTKAVCPLLYSFSRVEDGRRLYVLRPEFGDLYE